MGYLHGVETIEKDKGGKPINLVKTSIIGLVGIAPIGSKNVMTIVANERQGEELFGKQVPGFTIPQALSSIFAQGKGRVIVINVFDSTDHVATVAAESHVITNGKTKTTHAPVAWTSLTDNAGTPVVKVRNTDYTVDEFGNITVLNFTAIPEGSTVKANYKRLDASELAASDFIGESSPARTGFQLFTEAYTTFGYLPKILLCPTYGELAAVSTEMIERATALRAVALIDAPEGTSVAEAITARGPGGTIGGYTSASDRAILLTPYLKAYDVATNADDNRPYSPFFAGVMAVTDNDEGYWVSPSNHEIGGITGLEYALTAALNDEDSDANQLNEVGLVTVFSNFGTGFRTWGNRNASFPSSSAITSFISCRRVADILHESVEINMLPYVDKPINLALIDSVRGAVNAFIRILIGRGAIIDGECTFNADNNPPEELALGHLVFDITFVPPPPAERITFNSFIDINLLSKLV